MRRTAAGLVVAFAVALAAPAVAARHKILVLPVEGTADAATRGKLTADLARLARSLDGQVATGSATFADTALAVGCDPRTPGCSDEVMATLGVDELVWAIATRDGGQVRLIVRRAARGAPAREISTVFTTGESADRIVAGIAAVFAPPGAREPTRPPAAPGPTAPAPIAPAPTASGTTPPPSLSGAATAPGPAASTLGPAAAPGEPTPAQTALPGPADNRGDRTAGIALVAGGGVGLALGLALWASYASLQDQIDHHALRTRADFAEVRELEGTAGTRAIAGDLFVVAGLVAGGIGAYYLVRDHRRAAVVVAPAVIPGGGGLTITLIGGP